MPVNSNSKKFGLVFYMSFNFNFLEIHFCCILQNNFGSVRDTLEINSLSSTGLQGLKVLALPASQDLFFGPFTSFYVLQSPWPPQTFIFLPSGALQMLFPVPGMLPPCLSSL